MFEIEILYKSRKLEGLVKAFFRNSAKSVSDFPNEKKNETEGKDKIINEDKKSKALYNDFSPIAEKENCLGEFPSSLYSYI